MGKLVNRLDRNPFGRTGPLCGTDPGQVPIPQPAQILVTSVHSPAIASQTPARAVDVKRLLA